MATELTVDSLRIRILNLIKSSLENPESELCKSLTTIINNFLSNGGNADVWKATEDTLTFKSLTVEDVNTGWGRYVFTDNTYTARMLNTEGLTVNGVNFSKDTLSAVADGGMLSNYVLSNNGKTYERILVRVATGALSNENEL